jgi:uncharacterized protein (DUF2236 family)
MSVSRADLEQLVAELRAEVEDPRAGIFGPGSVNWKIGREAICFLAGGRAALLQLAHPFVAHAVDQHSHTRTDPLGRFVRTFANVFAMVFGDLDHAIASARRVHAVHERVTGTIPEAIGDLAAGSAYLANDEAALLWVHATLIDGALTAYELVLGRLPEAERARYYEECRRFGALFGIPAAAHPPTLAAFEAYNARMFARLRVAAPAREMAGFLLHPRAPHLRPAFAWYRVVTAGLLPAPVRAQYGLSFGRAERALFATSLASLRRIYPRLPAAVRQAPAYRDAVRRLAGLPGRDPTGERLERWILGALAGGWHSGLGTAPRDATL